MEQTSENRLLRQIMERLDVVESLLLNPERARLGFLLENLAQCANAMLALESVVRAEGGGAELRASVEEARRRLRGLVPLIEDAGVLLEGLQAHALGGYSLEGAPAAQANAAALVCQEG